MHAMGGRTVRLTSVAVAAILLLAVPTAARGADGPAAPPAPAVLAPVDLTSGSAPAPTAPGVKAAIGDLVRGSLGTASVLVLDSGTRTVLYAKGPDKARIPASTAKLTTAVAALTALDPQSRLATTAYRDGSTVYLVGGGDPTLVRRGGGNPLAGGDASLRDLARQTAAALGSGASVQVAYDASAFRGPRLGPSWPTSWPAEGVAAPVTALVVDKARKPGSVSRVADPPRQAGQAFATMLRDLGVTVTGVAPGARPGAAHEIGRVESASIADLVQRMLTDSDDDIAEALGHLAGGASFGEPTFAGGAKAATTALDDLGVDTSGLDLADASGLSRENRIPVRVLGDLLRDVALGEHPRLGTVSSGLAVAGLTGTLADRYTSAATKPGRGFVHAKTGTLTGVVGLAGTVLDADGRVLVFAMIANDVASIPATRETMDVVASRLATCGCSG
mgnify:CR=1 FL=1